jgi:hypothetical protein
MILPVLLEGEPQSGAIWYQIPRQSTKEGTGWATWSCAGVGGKDATVKRTGMY